VDSEYWKRIVFA